MSIATKSLKELREEAKADLDFAREIDAKGDDATPDELDLAQQRAANAKSIGDRLAGYGQMRTAEAITSAAATLGREVAPPVPSGGGNAGDNTAHLKAQMLDEALGGDGADTLPIWAASRIASGLFVNDERIRNYFKSIAPNGRVPDRTAIQSPVFTLSMGELQERFGDAVKTLVYQGSATSAGGVTWSTRRDVIAPLPGFGPFGLLDLVTRIPTASESIEYARITGFTNNAAPVAEATAATGSSGTKPESAITFAKVTDRVKTIAHWIPATTRALADAPQLRGIIDAFLRRGLERVLETEILTGDGTGEHFTGVLNTAGTLDQAYDTSLLVTTRKAITNIQINSQLGQPNAYLFHPSDWEDIELTQDAEDRWYFGGPLAMATPRLWGIPVRTSLGMTEGTAVLADWSSALLYDRDQTGISVSNSHSDFFVRNLVAILAELRAGFGILSPTDFCVIDLAA